MVRNSATTERLRNLISKIEATSKSGDLHWERQAGSAHRYARLNNNLLILGPAAPVIDSGVPRYLLITPFDSPICIVVNYDDNEFGADVIKMVKPVDEYRSHVP